ncbi:hypothetical protein [Chondromyces crocatus]|uniref:Right handed beta helix domain-containing protein n=1 Tax=Chondromyces crocatus TaxID=52 RepID=A0A0K1EJY9_CHOCO|nr:hypothetical protein [Chondromyces crocatus]AKT41002.1 uncharacterized protein CMC5_051590 [Chondromyces crocatus]
MRAAGVEHVRSRTWTHGLSIVALALFGAGCGIQTEENIDAEEFDEREEAAGTTYQVGPSRQYKKLADVANLLQPGDIVQVDGNATYAGNIRFSRHGTASQKITIRGVRVNGKRPVLSGGTNTVELAGNHYVFEGFDVTGGSSRCIFHHAHGITIRDAVVHDCPAHGILGADADSGSLLMEYVEVYACGSGTTRHPVYIATDETAYPGSVFRMQHCYIHDATGGNAVKSRAERNEIYYNWIEGGHYKELELIGPDGQRENLAREDGDVVGNVFRKTHNQFVVRVGGDGTGQSWGRYRFVNNTFLLKQGSSAAIHAFDGIESIELHNNIFHRVGGGGVQVLRDDGTWSTGNPIFVGAKNAVPQGSTVPTSLSQTITQNDPGFVNPGARDFRLSSSSPLRDIGVMTTQGPSGRPFPAPLALPLYHPPTGAIQALGAASARPVVGLIDLGAYEFGTGGSNPWPPDPPASCKVASTGVWTNTALATQTGTFTVTWNVTPSSSSIDGAVGLSRGAQTVWSGLAAIVLFDLSGRILVRNGATYQAATPFTYGGGQTYKVKMVVNVPNRKYSVYVQAPGGAETLLANQFSFRSEQTGASQLNNWTVVQDAGTGSISACDVTLQ